MADGGTLFLRRGREIPLDLQAKRCGCSRKEVGASARSGRGRSTCDSSRLPTATLRARPRPAVQAQDLFYRLSVFPVELPPLRSCMEDVPLLAEHFLALSARKLGRPKPRLTLANVQQLQRYHWPGNVRELQHVIERAVITAGRGRLAIELPAAAEPPSGSVDAPARDAAERVLTEAEVRRLEAENIRAALRRTGGKVSGAGGAAELLGMKPTTLASRIKALGMSPRSARSYGIAGQQL